MTTLSRTDFEAEIAAQLGAGRAEAKRWVDAILGRISGAIAAGDKVQLTGFGVFEPRDRLPRLGRNPQTGEQIDIPAQRQVKFRAGRELRDSAKIGGDARRVA